MRAAVAAAALILSVVALAGCVRAPDPVDPTSVLGDTVDDLSPYVSEDALLLVQDASPRLGVSPSYTGEPDLDGRWMIAAICTSADDLLSSSSIEVAVLPVASVTTEVRAKIRDGDYRDAVDCAGRPFYG